MSCDRDDDLFLTKQKDFSLRVEMTGQSAIWANNEGVQKSKKLFNLLALRRAKFLVSVHFHCMRARYDHPS